MATEPRGINPTQSKPQQPKPLPHHRKKPLQPVTRSWSCTVASSFQSCQKVSTLSLTFFADQVHVDSEVKFGDVQSTEPIYSSMRPHIGRILNNNRASRGSGTVDILSCSLLTMSPCCTVDSWPRKIRAALFLLFVNECRLLSKESQFVDGLASLSLCHIAVRLCLDCCIQLFNERLSYRLSELEKPEAKTILVLLSKR